MSHEPTDATRQLVQLHTTVGTPQDLIADLLGITSKTMRKHYRTELDQAVAKANATIGGALFNKAKGGDTTAMIFWMKTRAQWSERTIVDNTSSDGTMTPQPAAVFNLTNLSDEDLAAYERLSNIAAIPGGVGKA